MLHALLLSPDDQAVSAISGVLEEMSVTCERPLDGVSAAQKLNSQSFDLVLVDCENLPAAKLIFDVCRRGKSGNNPVPIAIVDGRAGLPTAFRLGAELILTKPVAKDQARSTIRTAISRVRKEVTINETGPDQSASETVTDDRETVTRETVTEDRAMAAAAGASPQLTSFAGVAPSFARGTVPPSYLTAALSASGLTTTMHSTMDEIAREIGAKPATPKLNPQFAPSSALSSELSSAEADSVTAKTVRPLNPADDLVLAELDRAELAVPEGAESRLENSSLEKAKTKKQVAGAQDPAPYPNTRHKSRGALIALLMLILAGTVFYATWRYQPGFRDIAQPRIYHLLNIANRALPPTQTMGSAKPSAQLAPDKSPATASQAPTNPTAAQPTPPNPTTVPTTTSTPASVAQSPATGGAALTIPTSGATSSTVVAARNPDVAKTGDSIARETKKEIAATPSSAASPFDAPLPGEKSAVILSSKGAEKRLAHSVPPKYPATPPLADAQGTVVLKTVVDKNGAVEGVRLVGGNATLATAAMQAVRQWRYRPYVRDGKALPFQTVVILDFQRP